MIIAIDGPSGSGKSSIASVVANKYNLLHIDTGGMYRAMTYHVLNNNIDLNDKSEVINSVNKIDLVYKDGFYYLNNNKLDQEIRQTIINQNVSKVAAIKEVREKAVEIQREIAKSYDSILDGRDICSVVFPNADLKIYLDASCEVRAKRRFEQMLENSKSDQSYEEVLEDIIKRDNYDKNREESPLIQTEDSIYIDSSNISFDETVNEISKLIEAVKNEL